MRLIDADVMMSDTLQEYENSNQYRNAIIRMINKAPTIDAVEVVRGEWIDKPTKGVRYICSRCTGRFDYQWKYCPNCGAKMSKESE